MPRSSGETSGRQIRRARMLRTESSVAEQIAWKKLRAGGMGFKFRRQFPIAGLVVDFYCEEARLCVEFDGEQHRLSSKSDADRDRRLAEMGILTLRVPNRSFLEIDPMDGVDWLRIIQRTCEERTSRPAFPEP